MTQPIRIARLACIAVVALAPLASLAQNVATVNGKPVPKSRVDLLLNQAARGGQQKSPELEQRAREEVVLREIFAQEAEKKGIPASADYRSQMELVRQTVADEIMIFAFTHGINERIRSLELLAQAWKERVEVKG